MVGKHGANYTTREREKNIVPSPSGNKFYHYLDDYIILPKNFVKIESKRNVVVKREFIVTSHCRGSGVV